MYKYTFSIMAVMVVNRPFGANLIGHLTFFEPSIWHFSRF